MQFVWGFFVEDFIMTINRRDFLKTLGAATATLSGLKLHAKDISQNPEFYGVLFDANYCSGCQKCEIACAETYNLPLPEETDKPVITETRKLNENRRTVVNKFKTDKGELFVKKQCMHCNQPACASACLTAAMKKTVEGPIIWRENKCMGCRFCMLSCPFDIPQFEYHSANPKISKCTMCFEKLKNGERPACVKACPEEALLFGTRRALIKEARRRIHKHPEKYVDHIYGEREAGGTSWLYLSPVPFEQIGFTKKIDTEPYPELTKGFLYSVPFVFVLWPALMLGMSKANDGEENS